MKTIFSDELKSRLSHAAENGSVIASAVLAELKSGKEVSEVIRGSANYFSTKRKKTTYDNYASVKIVFTACTKDITNKNFPDRLNPQAPWFPENRTDVDPSTFIGYFKNLPEYTSNDLDFFNSAICMDSKITIKLYDKMNDIIEAYKGENYSPIVQYGETTLHNSCMRSEDVARKIGIHLRKKVNDYEHARSFIALNPVDKYSISRDTVLEDLHLKIRVPASRWHKKGAPYLDTFSEIHIVDKSAVELTNYYSSDQLGVCRSTYGKATRNTYFCPICGKTHNDDAAPLCKTCHKGIYVDTPFGYAIEGKAVDYNGKLYPSVLFKKGRPIPNFRLYLKLERLF